MNTISLNEGFVVNKVKKEANKAKKKAKKAKEKAKNTGEKVGDKIEDTGNKIIDDVTDNFSGATKAIDDVLNTALKKLNDAAKKASQDVENTGNMATQGVNNAATTATKNINVATDTATQSVNNVANKAVKDVNDVANKAVKDVNDAVKGVEGVTNDVIKGVESAGDKAVEGVENVANKAKNDLENFANSAKDAIVETVDKSFMGIQKIIGELLEIGKKLMKFFVGFEDYWKQFQKAAVFFKNAKNITAFILTVTIPFIGQIIARFMILNGSLDKPWLFLFSIPPLTLVPAFAMMFSFIEPTKGGLPWDSMVFLPIMGTVIGSFLAKGHKSRNIFKILFSFGSFALAYWYKTTKLCKKGYDTDKVLLDSVISYMFVIIFALILPLLPYIGNVVAMIQAVVPMSDLFIQALAVFIVYVGTNVVNGSFGGHCKATIKNEDIYKVLFAAVCLTIVTAFSPGDMTSIVMDMAQNSKIGLMM